MEPKSPCKKPECVSKDKTKCCDSCRELAAYQRYLQGSEAAITPGYSESMELPVQTDF